MQAELWLTKKLNTFRKPEKRRICEDAQSALRSLPWAGKTYGFTEDEPATRLAEYLSDAWLATVHINQQLDLLRWHVLRSAGSDTKCEVVNVEFFRKVLEVYRDREKVPYDAERKGARHIWAVGEELAAGIRSGLCGIVNIEESHWVAVAIEVLELVVWYGDALGGSDVEVCEALVWWIRQHVKKDFRLKDLPISKQRDTYSCSILALNSLWRLCLPDKINLLDPSDAAHERISCFVRVAKRIMDCVSLPFVMYKDLTDQRK
ncbi:hypothetical protein FPV67DRAFT_1435028 [Lyophyllum atratum]|nr:hypothetical protein FPV67DRAFT_1435028 [Lyophyllum atratum]